MPGRFLDTNVIVYLGVRDAQKADRSEALVRGGHIGIQVLNEFVRVTRYKLNWSWSEISRFIVSLKMLVEVHPMTTAVHDLGRDLAEHHQFNIYDALIVAAALEADCDVLYSEDMQHGLRVAGQLTIVNPFV